MDRRIPIPIATIIFLSIGQVQFSKWFTQSALDDHTTGGRGLMTTAIISGFAGMLIMYLTGLLI
jgi:hypothetical protein